MITTVSLRPRWSAVLCLVLIISLFISHARSDCYWPSGDVDGTNTPCLVANNVQSGTCCAPNDLCLDNHLCRHQNTDGTNYSYRGSCTDPTWSLGGCPNFCIDGNSTGTVVVHPCFSSTNRWYCEGDSSVDCSKDNGAGVVILPGDTSAYYTLGVERTAPPTTITQTSPSTTSLGSGDSFSSVSGQSTTSPSTGAVASSEVGTAVSHPHSGGNGMNETSSGQQTGAPIGHTASPPTAATGTALSHGGVGTQDPGGQPAPNTGTPAPDSSNDTSTVPMAVGVSFGSLIFVSAGALGFFYVRKRRREAPARAETPPPYDTDIGVAGTALGFQGPFQPVSVEKLGGGNASLDMATVPASLRVPQPRPAPRDYPTSPLGMQTRPTYPRLLDPTVRRLSPDRYELP